jgi:hypothetical protein
MHFVKHPRIFPVAQFWIIDEKPVESTVKDINVRVKQMWIRIAIQFTINRSEKSGNLRPAIMTEFTMKHKKSVFMYVCKEARKRKIRSGGTHGASDVAAVEFIPIATVQNKEGRKAAIVFTTDNVC